MLTFSLLEIFFFSQALILPQGFLVLFFGGFLLSFGAFIF